MGKHTPPLLRKIFRNEHIRREVFSHLSSQDISSLRGTSARLRKVITAKFFETLTVTFSGLSFSSDRLLALERIGHHVKVFSFIFPHSEETYMPPMLDPKSRKSVSLLYEPSPRQGEKRPKRNTFGSKSIDSLALHNYGILLMAALDAPQFKRALACMVDIKTLIVSCPGAPMGEPGRRCVVDYALLSLRMAIERARPQKLRKIVLDPLHLTGLQYFLPGVLAVGSVIDSRRIWSKVTTLTMTVSAWKELANGSPTLYKTQLKFLHQFLEYFNNVEDLKFTWTREARSLCPLTLDLIPYRNPILASKSDRDRSVVNRPLVFPKLATLRLENIGMNASDLRTFLSRHMSHFKQWSLDDVYFINGTLEEALKPLSISNGYTDQLRYQGLPSPEGTDVSFMDLFKEVSLCSLELVCGWMNTHTSIRMG